MPETFVLYAGDRSVSSWSMRAYVALTHKGAEFEERTIRLLEDRDRSQRRKVSPTGRVPVLHHGDAVVPDSLAIIEYLEEVLPPPAWPALWPTDRRQRAHARWLSAEMHAGFRRVRKEMSFDLCFAAEAPPPSEAAVSEARGMMELWESALASVTEPSPFLFGAFGGVDAMYAPAVVRLAAFEIPTAGLPRAEAYMKAVLRYPAVRRWLEGAPPIRTARRRRA